MICTVVIPVSYGEETIGACLEALVRQEGVELNRDYTIVLVNDGSTDGTLDIARRFPISILNMPVNSGRIAARLAGARVAMTSLILFVDSKVMMERDAVAQIEDMRSNQCFMCVMHEPGKLEMDWFNRCFYLIRSKYYIKLELVLLLSGTVLTFLGYAGAIILILLSIFILTCIYLADGINDFLILLLVIPIINTVFCR